MAYGIPSRTLWCVGMFKDLFSLLLPPLLPCDEESHLGRWHARHTTPHSEEGPRLTASSPQPLKAVRTIWQMLWTMANHTFIPTYSAQPANHYQATARAHHFRIFFPRRSSGSKLLHLIRLLSKIHWKLRTRSQLDETVCTRHENKHPRWWRCIGQVKHLLIALLWLLHCSKAECTDSTEWHQKSRGPEVMEEKRHHH